LLSVRVRMLTRHRVSHLSWDTVRMLSKQRVSHPSLAGPVRAGVRG